MPAGAAIPPARGAFGALLNRWPTARSKLVFTTTLPREHRRRDDGSRCGRDIAVCAGRPLLLFDDDRSYIFLRARIRDRLLPHIPDKNAYFRN